MINPDLKPFLLQLAEDAGALAMSHFGQLRTGEISAKGPLDLVTVADRAVEDLIVARLRATFPDDGILGEETGQTAGMSDRIWAIDPIDGTFNFVRAGRQWSISIGLWQAGVPVMGVVHAPVAGLTLIGGTQSPPELNGAPLAPLARFDPALASVGFGLGGQAFPLAERLAVMERLQREAGAMVRVCNCATHGLIEVATGEADAYVGYGEAAWDVMGMWPVLTPLGAISDLGWQAAPDGRKLRFVIGKPAAVGQIAPILEATRQM